MENEIKCQVCDNHFEYRSNKQFCSRNCKAKFRYNNDLKFRQEKISKSADRVLNERYLQKMKLNGDLIKQAAELQITGEALELYKLIYKK